MVSNGVVEEPISSELVLVDEALARRARAALPDPPWLLPVLAELEQAALAETPPAPKPAAAGAPDRPAPRQRPRVALAVSFLLALAALALLSLAFLPLSRGPTLVTTPLRQAGPAVPARPPVTTRPKRAAHPPSTRPVTRDAPKPKAVRKNESAAPAKHPSAQTTRRAPPRPQTLASAQRVLGWHRYPSAVFYEVHLQRGAETIYEMRTVRLQAVLPARLTLRPGAYRLLVRPAIPSDAGIILGAPIFRRTLRV